MRDDSTMRRARSSVSSPSLRKAPRRRRSRARLRPRERSGNAPARRLLSIAARALLVWGVASGVSFGQQAPAPPELPSIYRGTPIDEAIKGREWPHAEALL